MFVCVGGSDCQNLEPWLLMLIAGAALSCPRDRDDGLQARVICVLLDRRARCLWVRWDASVEAASALTRAVHAQGRDMMQGRRAHGTADKEIGMWDELVEDDSSCTHCQIVRCERGRAWPRYVPCIHCVSQGLTFGATRM
jgi:hypothetical protein